MPAPRPSGSPEPTALAEWRVGAPDDEPALAPVDLRTLLGTLRRHLRLLLLVTLLAGGATYAYVRRQPASYQATAVIRLDDSRRAMAGRLGVDPREGLTGRVVDPLLSLIEVLTSRRVAGLVVDSLPILRLDAKGFPLRLLSDVYVSGPDGRDSVVLEFGAEDVVIRADSGTRTLPYGKPVHVGPVRFTVTAPPSKLGTGVLRVLSRESAIDRLRGRLRVKPRDQTDVADVTFIAPEPALAQQVVNRVVVTFRAVSAAMAQQESRLRREFVEEQLRENERHLIRAQQELSAFRSDAQLYSSRERLSSEQAAIAQMDIRRQELEADLRLYRNALDALEHRGGDLAAVGALVSVPNATANPMIGQAYARLVQLRTSRDSMTAGPWGSAETNPDVMRIDSLIQTTEHTLRESVRSLIASLEARVRGVDALKAQNAVAFRDITNKETTEAQLVQQVEALRALADQLRQEYQRARIAEAVEVGQVEILDAAGPPRGHLGIGPLRKTAFGTAVGFFLGCVLALVMEQLNTSIRRRGQVRTALRVPELAVIPQLEVRSRRRLRSGRRARAADGAGDGRGLLGAGLVTIADLESSGAEAYRLLRTNLLFSRVNGPPRTVVVTSPAPGDGKTTVASNLAVTFAQQGMRTLLVDADLRRGRLHQLFQIPREPGLTQLLREELAPADAVRPTSVDRLFVLPMGTVPKAPAELLGKATMRALVEQLGRDFDIVIIDTTPVLAAADVSVVASLVDATIVVLRAGQTDEEEAQETVRQLWAVGARIVGAVLNDQDAKIGSYEGHYYAGYYPASRGTA